MQVPDQKGFVQRCGLGTDRVGVMFRDHVPAALNIARCKDQRADHRKNQQDQQPPKPFQQTTHETILPEI